MHSKIKIILLASTFLLLSFVNVAFAAVSPLRSKISPATEMAKTLSEVVEIKVQLLDESGGPVSGHLVKLISSSAEDVVIAKDKKGISDQYGQVFFNVVGGKNGVSTYSAYDFSADTVLHGKSRILYFDSLTELSGDASYKNYSGNASGPVDSLKFEDVPLKIEPGDEIDFKLSAVDENDQMVQSYDGKIRFVVSGANSNYAKLPQDYTFTTEDLGSHTFSLAMSFQQPGNYLVRATDLDNQDVYGEQAFVVTAGDGSGTSNSSGISISSPASGTVSNNVLVISGSAPAGARLKIFDNEIPLTTVIADGAGKFSYTSGALPEGEHKIYVAHVNEVDTIIATSATVNLKIDMKAPEISKVELDPKSPVDPAVNVKVKLYVTDTLAQAKLNFAGNVYEMTKNAAGYYEVVVTAPIEFSEYPLSFTLVDELGNEANFKDYSKLTVGVMGAKTGAPTTVSNLAAIPGPNKVILTWNAPSNANVKHYRVFYGNSPNQLINVVDTFTGATTWYVPNLENGKSYYFAVAAVDDKGNTSTSFEKIAVATPGGGKVVETPPVEVLNGKAGEEALKEMKKDVSESGPEILWLIWLSALGGICYVQFGKKGIFL